MAWCPNCKNEYREGITVCADCGAELVDTLDENAEENAEAFAGYSEEVVALADAVTDEDGIIEDDPFRSKKEMGEIDIEEEGEYIASSAKTHKYVYQNREEKTEEFRSSGVILLIVGILGFIFVALVDLKLLPFTFGNMVIMNIVTIALFGFFVVFGIISLRSAKKYAGEAIEEKNLTKEIKRWFLESYDANAIDQNGNANEAQSEELLYFARTEFMKDTINEKFMNLSEDYLDDLVDKLYQELFEE